MMWWGNNGWSAADWLAVALAVLAVAVVAGVIWLVSGDSSDSDRPLEDSPAAGRADELVASATR